MAFPILAGLTAVKALSGLFKKRGKASPALDSAVAVVENVVGAVQKDQATDPEAFQVLKDHELLMEQEYTKQAAAALKVMNTEAASADPLVRRARPTLMYVGYTIMLCQMVIFPCFGIKITEFVDLEIIHWFYYMFGAGYLGYGVLRTVDKKSGKMPGITGIL